MAAGLFCATNYFCTIEYLASAVILCPTNYFGTIEYLAFAVILCPTNYFRTIEYLASAVILCTTNYFYTIEYLAFAVILCPTNYFRTIEYLAAFAVKIPIMRRRSFLLLPLAAVPFSATAQSVATLPGVDQFIDAMHTEHAFIPQQLRDFFSRLQVSERAIELMDAPATPGKKTYWREYRRRLLMPGKIAEGAKFMRRHTALLARAENEFGTPREIIVAILGIETRYGSILGDFNIARTLSTLAFAYPRRAEEFRQQLRDFLIYSRQAGINPLQLNGSFAGAFGLPQFLPSSARQFAVDFDDNQRADLFSIADSIGSIGNFLMQHGWRRGGAIAYAINNIDNPKALIKATENNNYKPLWTPKQLAAEGVLAAEPLRDELYLLVDLENRYDTEYRLGAQNFYTITRYNKSFKYAAAVFDLSVALRRYR